MKKNLYFILVTIMIAQVSPSTVCSMTYTDEDLQRDSPEIYNLLRAVYDNHISALQQLLDAGAPVFANSEIGTVLHMAAKNKRVECMKMILTKAKAMLEEDANKFDEFVNAVPPDQNITALMFAIYNGSEACVKLLLDAGACVNANYTTQDGEKHSSINVAAEFNKEILQILLNHCRIHNIAITLWNPRSYNLLQARGANLNGLTFVINN